MTSVSTCATTPSQGAPTVSIGLPVYNGQRYLEQAIDSILAQSFEDLELILADNASNDGTQEICERYVGQDERVRYFRHAENLGAAVNSNFVFEQSRGEYFKWAAHDDWLEPRYLEVCINRLKSDPSLALCHTASRLVDAEGAVFARAACDRPLLKPRSGQRFKAVLHAYDFSVIWGVMPRSIVAQTVLMPRYPQSDQMFLGDLLMRGGLALEESELFNWRIHEGTYRQAVLPNGWERWTWWDPTMKPFHMGQSWHHLICGTRIVGRAPIGIFEKIGCLFTLYTWLIGNLTSRKIPRSAPAPKDFAEPIQTADGAAV